MPKKQKKRGNKLFFLVKVA